MLNQFEINGILALSASSLSMPIKYILIFLMLNYIISFYTTFDKMTKKNHILKRHETS